MREALKLALDYIVATNKSSEFWLIPASNLNKTVTAIKETLAQSEQESGKIAPPKEWGEVSREELIKRELEMVKRIAKAELTLDGLTPTEFALRELYEFQEATGCDTAIEFKTQRKPLTDEQIYQMWTDEGLANSYEIYSLKEHVRRTARAIEAAHGIKK